MICSISLSISNTSITANLGNAVKIAKTDNVGIMMACQGNASGTGVVTITWARSADGITYETTPRFTTLCVLNNTTAVASYTNISASVIGPSQFIKLVSIANADATASGTNASIKVFVKTLKPSP